MQLMYHVHGSDVVKFFACHVEAHHLQQMMTARVCVVCVFVFAIAFAFGVVLARVVLVRSAINPIVDNMVMKRAPYVAVVWVGVGGKCSTEMCPQMQNNPLRGC